MAAFYHVCFAVPDLAAAMRDLGAAADLEWGEPPFVELIAGPAGSRWPRSTRTRTADQVGCAELRG
jgi:hypothetical protein